MIIFFEKHKRLLVSLLIGIVMIGMSKETTVYAEDSLSMYSGSYALMDGETGRVLTGKNETDPMANASTTKILTCIVTLENCNLNEVVVVSANAASQPKVRLGMSEGEEYSLEELLYGLMLESYNDCAVAIAEHVAGSTEGFADMLNQKAKEIGCTDTYFITPNGLDAEDENGFHHTTATDLCRIMAYCTWESPMKDTFLKITQTGTYNSFVNRNAFLDQMDGVLSGKTGFTNKAGYCYVAALEQNGEKYCIALLACGWPDNKTYKWSDAKTLFGYGLDNYDVKTVKIKNIADEIEVDGYVGDMEFSNLNQTGTLTLSAENRQYKVLLSENENLKAEVEIYSDIELPIAEGQEMGVCKIYLDDTLLDAVSLTAETNAAEWNLKEIVSMILFQFLTFSL